MRWFLFNMLFAGSCGYALLAGGKPERRTVVIFVCARAMTASVQPSGSHAFEHLQYGILFVDVLALLAMLAVTLTTRRWWPVWMSGLQGAMVVSHSVQLSPLVNAFAYYAAIASWAYPMLALLVIATWRTSRRIAHPDVQN